LFGQIPNWISQAPLESIFDLFENIFRRDINKKIPCLQRKINKLGNDIIKTNYRCIKNKLNQWHFKSSGKGKFISIISAYDGKCLNYNLENISSLEDGLYV